MRSAVCLAVLLGTVSFALAQDGPAPVSNSYPSTYKPLPRKDTLIRNATVLDGAGHRLDDTSVLMSDGKIIAMGKDIVGPAGTVILDATGRWVTPGIVDPHSHIGDFPTPITLQDYKHSDVNEDTNPNTAQVWALHSIHVQDPEFERVRAGGVTTLQVLPGSSNLFGGLGVVLKNVPAVTPQQMEFPGAVPALKMACGANPKETYGDRDQFPASTMGVVAGDRQAWVDAEAYRHKWDEYYAKRDPKLEPPARDLRADVLAAALRGQVTVVVHCYRADDMAVMMDLAKEFHFHITAFHHAAEAYKIVPLLKQNQVCVAVWPNWWGFKLEAYDAVPANAAFVEAEGGCVMLHSDAVISGERMTLDAAIAIGAGRRAGVDIPRERAIEWLTINPARSLRLESQIGSLEPGKNADVVVWSGDPFSVYTKADVTFIDGAVVYDRRDSARQAVTDFELGQPALEKSQ